MSVEELVAEALKLDPETRARIADRLLESLCPPIDPEVQQAWAEEAQRRDAEWDHDPECARPAADVLRDALSNLK